VVSWPIANVRLRKFGALGAAIGRSPLLFWLLLGTPACGSKDDVTLSAKLDNARVSVATVALGSQLSGEFDLVLALGDYAPEGTEVTLGAFALRNTGGVVVEGLPLMASQTFPIAVAVGKSVAVHMTLDTNGLIDNTLVPDLCDGQIWYSGTVNDTLSDGKSTVAESTLLTASCPQ
jgi:hypothetical protein